eukprot:Lithocolla_globosa_v1_NODE_10738_length_571_cov_12.151163.p1 type:complete len:154 gc:universal NODE_10738_length_571_cov_12.151163:516-55(-)
MTRTRKVCICLDGSVHAKHAFEYYLEQIHASGDVVHLTSAYPAYETLGAAGLQHTQKAASMAKMYETTLENNCKKMFEPFAEKLTEEKIPYELVVLKGAPKYAIVQYINENDVEMAVTGSRGLSGLKKFVLGSTSDYILHYAHCSVFVVPDHK